MGGKRRGDRIHQDGRRIEQDDATRIGLDEPRKQLARAIRGQQFGNVARLAPGPEHGEAGHVSADHERFRVGRGIGERIDQARARLDPEQSEHVVLGDIAVDEQHLGVALAGKAQREVRGAEALPLARPARRDEHRPPLFRAL